MPNFLIIGAMKAGTTSVYRYLKQHPQVYMSPKKEPEFFALEGRKLDFNGPEGRERVNRDMERINPTTIEGYRELFNGVCGEKAIGEASLVYQYSQQAPERIKHHIPEARLITILRNPTERAYSAFSYLRLEDREPISDFSRALQAEEARILDNWKWVYHYKSLGFYHDQLKRYFDMFDRDQIKVYLYDDLRADIPSVMKSMFRFLEVDDGYTPDTSLRHNISGVPRSGPLSSLIDGPNPIKTTLKPFIPEELRWRIVARLKKGNLVEPPTLDPLVRGGLIEAYQEDIRKLEDLIGRDLSAWLE
jgi:hypothetical protein